jgi:hypothetical protein
MNETPAGISTETLFHIVKQYVFFYINKSIIPIVTFCHGFFIYVNELLNYSVLYKKLLSNMSIDSLRELNAKLLAEIAELRKENADFRLRKTSNWRKIFSINLVNATNNVYFIHCCKGEECTGSNHDFRNSLYVYFFKDV